MPAPATVDEFVDLIRKSAVLEEARLAAYVDKLKTDPNTPRDLSSIAGLFVRDGLLTFFQAEQFLQGKWKRFTIGKYKVLERLGSGGMGQVFLCEHKLMRRRVAVKVLPTQKAADPSSLERFYREARAVAALDHPNIVRAYDIDQDDNLHFLVMEYVDGASLQEMIRKTGPMDPVRACHYMYWSAVGLQHAHAQGLIHRDIKPGNILVDRTGVVKILDLGLARFFNDDEDLLTKKYDESVLGTADYLAPEQAVDSHTVDGRADIYSLGATFYFLLTGQPPFAEGTVAQKLLWHQSKNPRPVREVRAAVPEPVARVVTRMMAKKPEDRYQTPGELAEALLPFTQTPIPPPPEEEMPQLSAAAQGAVGGTGAVTVMPPRTIVSAPRTPPPAPNPKGTVRVEKPAPVATKPAAPPAPAPRGNNGVPAGDADTQRKANPAPVVEPIPDSAPGTPIWEAISAETANNQRADTQKNKRDASSRKVKVPAKADSKAGKSARVAGRRQGKAPLIATLGGGVVLVGVGVAIAVWLGGGCKPPPTNGSGQEKREGPRRLSVTKGATGPLQFTSIQKAITEASPGDTIIIEDPEWEESVAATQLKNLTITAANGKRVVWRGSSKQPQNYILSLANMEGARVVGITFQATPNVDHAIRLAGHCPGLIVENVDLVSGKVAPLLLHDCSGDKSRPVTIRNCRVTGTAGAAAVVFKADPAAKPGFAAPGSRAVLIDECLVQGPDAGPGVLFEGSATAELRHCRFWKGTGGVQFHRPPEKPASDLLWNVTVTGSTFHSQSQAAVWVDDAPVYRNRPENRLTLAQNFFAAVPAVVRLDGDVSNLAFLTLDPSNVRKTGTPPFQPGNLPLPAPAENPADVNTDSSNPTKLLTYDRSSPLMKAAPGEKPAGVPPE